MNQSCSGTGLNNINYSCNTYALLRYSRKLEDYKKKYPFGQNVIINFRTVFIYTLNGYNLEFISHSPVRQKKQ